MKQYIDIVKHVLENGKEKRPVRKNHSTGNWEPVDGGVMTLACPNVLFSHDMCDGFPLLTTKRIAWKAVRVELEFFIKGLKDKKWLQDRGVKIWNQWANQELVNKQMDRFWSYDESMTNPEEDFLNTKKQIQLQLRDLGPIYGVQWRNFDGEDIPVPQIIVERPRYFQDYNDDNDDFVGTEHTSKKYGNFIVMYSDGKTKSNNKTYAIKFRNTYGENFGITKSEIEKDEVKDVYAPSAYGVACFGIPDKKPFSKKQYKSLYNTWNGMISRCYNVKNKKYSSYGGDGVYVDNRWLVFEYFLQDVILLANWKHKEKEWDEYSLDKDLSNQKCYSLQTCLWLDLKHQSSVTRKQKHFKAISPEGKIYFGDNIREFSRDFDLNSSHVSACIRGERKSHKNWLFEEIKTTKPKKVDQLANIVDTLKNNPMDRRMVCMNWNPKVLNKQALPACHTGFIVNVIDNELNLFFHQRSCDLMLGVPFNIASYALLLSLLAEVGGFKRGNLSGMLVDCHIYENQIEAAREQITREPQPLPKLQIVPNQIFEHGQLQAFENQSFDIFDWTHEDVQLTGYNPLDKIDFGKVTV